MTRDGGAYLRGQNQAVTPRYEPQVGLTIIGLLRADSSKAQTVELPQIHFGWA